MDNWKKSLYTVWIAQTVCITGFYFALPFLPFYIQELGITDIKEVALWAGLLVMAPSLMLIISTPFWGILADKFGRKIMLERAMFSACVILLLMGFAKNVQQLFILRLIQGFFTGTIPSSIILVSSFTPRKNSGYSLGLIQTSVFVGAAIGPWIGGHTSDLFGYKIAFFISAFLTGLAGLIVLFYVKEKFIRPVPVQKEKIQKGKNVFQNKFLFVLTMLFLVQLAVSIIIPIFPLFVQQLTVSSKRLASTTGTILALAGLFGAVSAIISGKVNDKFGYKNILIILLVCSGIFSILQAFSKNTSQLLWFRIFFSLFIGGIIPLLNSIIHQRVLKEEVGKTFGIAGSISSIGAAMGPIIGGTMASLFSINIPFVFSGILLISIGVIGYLRIRFDK